MSTKSNQPEFVFAQRNSDGKIVTDETGELLVKAFGTNEEVIKLLVIACPSIAEAKDNQGDTVEIIPNSKRNFYRKKIVKALKIFESWGTRVEIELFVSNIQPLLHRLAKDVGSVDTFVEMICATEEIYQTIGHFLLKILGDAQSFVIETPYRSDDPQDPDIDTILNKSFNRIKTNVIESFPPGENYTINRSHYNHLQLLTEPEEIENIENIDPEILEAVGRFKNLIRMLSQLNIDWTQMSDKGEEFLLGLYALDTLHLMEKLFNPDDASVWMSIQKNDLQNDLIQRAVEDVNQGEIPFPVILDIQDSVNLVEF